MLTSARQQFLTPFKPRVASTPVLTEQSYVLGSVADLVQSKSSASSFDAASAARPPTTSYLALIKEHLNCDEYTEFRKILKQYKESKATDILFDRIIALFDTHHELLEGFTAFVPKRALETYRQRMAEVIAKKETLSLPSNNVAEEPRDMKVNCAETEAQQNTFDEGDGGERGEKRKLEQTFDLYEGRFLKRARGESDVDIEGEGAPVMNSAPSFKCPICLDAFTKPYKAKCGHVCCFLCWKSWLETKLECPLCKQRVRFKKLEPIFLI